MPGWSFLNSNIYGKVTARQWRFSVIVSLKISGNPLNLQTRLGWVYPSNCNTMLDLPANFSLSFNLTIFCWEEFSIKSGEALYCLGWATPLESWQHFQMSETQIPAIWMLKLVHYCLDVPLSMSLLYSSCPFYNSFIWICLAWPQRVALVDQEVDGRDLLLDAPDAPQDLLLEANGHRPVEPPYLVKVPQSRPVWNENISMRRFQSGFKRHSHQF